MTSPKILKALEKINEDLDKMTPEEIVKMIDEHVPGDIAQFVIDMEDFAPGIQKILNQEE